jgi:hypothetical protein
VNTGSAWRLSSSSDPDALALVDGTGRFEGHGPHYSRRTPGSRTFTRVGQEVVFVTERKDAVWAVVRQRTPSAAGSGASRGRDGKTDINPRFVWRNMLFRNLGSSQSSALILDAVISTYSEWVLKYGSLPIEVLRTEIDPRRVRSTNPGYCYKRAGFHNHRSVRGKVYLDAPCPTLVTLGSCACCPGSVLQDKLQPGWMEG